MLREHLGVLCELQILSIFKLEMRRRGILSEWMAKAAALIGSSPITTSPSSFTRMRSETQICEKC